MPAFPGPPGPGPPRAFAGSRRPFAAAARREPGRLCASPPCRPRPRMRGCGALSPRTMSSFSCRTSIVAIAFFQTVSIGLWLRHPRRARPIVFLDVRQSPTPVGVSLSHPTHLRCPHNRACACHAVSRANDDECRLGVAGKSVCLQHTPRVTNVIHGTISISCTSLPRHTTRHRRVSKQSCFHAELPKWVCADLRPAVRGA